MKKHTKTLLSRLLMVVILFAISPACTDNYEEGMELSEEYLYAYIYTYGYIKKDAAEGSLSLSYEGSRFSLTEAPAWVILDSYNLGSGKGTEVRSQEINYLIEPNWTGSTREAAFQLTAYSSDGASLSNRVTVSQGSYTHSDLYAYMFCTNYADFYSGNSVDGTLEIRYRGAYFEITGVPDWITIQNYDFKKCTRNIVSDYLDIHADANYTGSERVAEIIITAYLGDGKHKSDGVHIRQYSK